MAVCKASERKVRFRVCLAFSATKHRKSRPKKVCFLAFILFAKNGEDFIISCIFAVRLCLLTLNIFSMKKHTAPPAARNIAALYRERDIAKLQQENTLLKEQLTVKDAALKCAEKNNEFLNKVVGEQAIEIADWRTRYQELQLTCEEMQRRFYQLEQVTGDEQDVKVDAMIGELMRLQSNDGTCLIRMGRQWWGIYRILVDDLGYESSQTRFVKRMQARGWDKARIPINLSNMKAIEGTIFTKPFDQWLALKHKMTSEPYFYRHYDVANMLRTLLSSG